MTEEEIDRRYDHYLSTGANTQEKHIRHVAATIVEEYKGGFEHNHHLPSTYRVPWRRRRGATLGCSFNENDSLPSASAWADIPVRVPPGMHGFALQLVIEDQLREAILS